MKDHYDNVFGVVHLKESYDKIPKSIREEIENCYIVTRNEKSDGHEYDLEPASDNYEFWDEALQEVLEKFVPYVDEHSESYVEFLCAIYWEVTRIKITPNGLEHQIGRVIYENADQSAEHSKRLELLGSIIESLEDFLERKGITKDDIPCEDRDEAIRAGEDPEGLCLIYGCDYGDLENEIEQILINYGLLNPEN